jgi:hypothetical protein
MSPTIAVAATPSPPPRIRTPPTPRFGYADNWEPFTPRKSSRISQRTINNRTPSPKASRRNIDTTTNTSEKPKTRITRPPTGTISPYATPQKKRFSSTPVMDALQGKQSRLTSESSAKAASTLGMDNSHLQLGSTTVSQGSGMLPTPAKTPKKAPIEANPAIKAIARNLFGSDEDAMPSPSQKRAKKYSGISMESFRAEEVEDSIEIFTDTQERIPQKDESVENPFYGENFSHLKDSPRRRSLRRQVVIPGEGQQTVEEAIKREDGMIFAL